MHKSRARSNTFEGPRSEHTANRTTKRAIKANKITKTGTIPADDPPQNWLIRLTMLEEGLRNCALPKAKQGQTVKLSA